MVVTACATAPDAKEMIYVGSLMHDCKSIVNHKSIVSIPENFTLRPLEAAAIFQKNSSYGCLIKMGFSVYADNHNYYIVNNNQLAFKSINADAIKKFSFIIDAQSGKLLSIPDYERRRRP